MDLFESLPGLSEESCDYLSVRFHPVIATVDCMVLELVGSIDSYNCHFLRRQLTRLIDAGLIRLILLLSRVD
jgi:anti-anti-sigma regulatory factor